MNRFSFSGHETFVCKQFWLKKGYDHIKRNYTFSDPNAVVHLGVGKNMVGSIQFWMKAFGLLEEDGRTPDKLATFIFDNDGYDPYLENLGTVWLLHHKLVCMEKASLYSLVFNDFRKERQEFTKDHLAAYVRRRCEEIGISANDKTLANDITVFVKSYVRPDDTDRTEAEDSFTGLLIYLDLMKSDWRRTIDEKTIEYFTISNEDRPELPYHMVLYGILDMLDDQNKGTSISMRQLQTERNAPGLVFGLNNECLHEKVKAITRRFPQVVFADNAGVQTLQFKDILTKKDVLDDYYNPKP